MSINGALLLGLEPTECVSGAGTLLTWLLRNQCSVVPCCNSALRHLDEADSANLQQLQESADPVAHHGSAVNAYVRLKIYLDAGNAAAATEQVQRAGSCADFSPHILEVGFNFL